MKKIGIVGGVAWASTLEYYAEICRRSEERHIASRLEGVPSTPEMTIESLDHRKAVAYLGTDGDEDSWADFDEYHRAALRRLESAGADFGLIASNTPHHRLETIMRGVKIPVLSLFEAVASETAQLGVKRVLILGTALTMRSQRFRDEFSKHGIEAAGPRDESARAMTIQLIEGLQLGHLQGAADRLMNIAKLPSEGQDGSQSAVCLACTELPLAFPLSKARPWFELDGTLYINTTIVHARAAFERAVE
jgi:aspartate racemase